jgi:lysophospholipase L1-like esterase
VTLFRRSIVSRVTLALLAAALARPAAAQQVADRWEKEIAAFEASDRVSPPPRGEIVFVGSSTIHHWDTAASFPDLKTINRGVWVDGQGFELGDTLRFVDRIVIPYQPRVIVVYAGDNDISGGKTSEQVVVDAEKFVRRVRAKLPDVRIVFIGLKPSIARWIQVDRMRITNAMLRQLCERDDRIAYVDVDGPMMGWDEKPRRELFTDDGLHLSAEGYRLWATLLRPFLLPPTPGANVPAASSTSARP